MKIFKYLSAIFLVFFIALLVTISPMSYIMGIDIIKHYKEILATCSLISFLIALWTYVDLKGKKLI